MVTLYTKDWNIKNIDTVLFDKDGTFIDAHLYWGRIIRLRIKAVMNYYKISEDKFEELCLSLGYDCSKQKLIEKGPIALLARDAVISSLLNKLEEYGVEAEQDVIKDIFTQVHKEFLPEIYDYVKVIDGAEDLFKRLQVAGVRMAVVTSDVKANADAILNYLNLSKYFDLVIGKDNCTKAKNTGEPALIAIKELNADPATTISVGDAPMDFEMAKNSGLKGSILVSTGQIPANKLKEYSETTVISLKEVFIK